MISEVNPGNIGQDLSTPHETGSNWDRLCRWFQRDHFYLVAFSGGVDSTLVLKAAVAAVGSERVLAVTADSASLPRSELALTKLLVEEIGARQLVLQTHELQNPDYRANEGSRCYFCKSELYRSLFTNLKSAEVTAALFAVGCRIEDSIVVDGLNLDDLRDVRPGRRAAEEAGVRHPLVECDIRKSEAREIAKEAGLSNWNKPAMACLSSRIPIGTQVNPERLSLIERAEEAIRAAGFSGVRVRLHVLPGPEPKNLARIEIAKSELAAFSIVESGHLCKTLRDIGFHFVTLDLEGYKLGGVSQG